jgi:hypothetical protein
MLGYDSKKQKVRQEFGKKDISKYNRGKIIFYGKQQ